MNKFKIGDKVRLKKDRVGGYNFALGVVLTVTAVNDYYLSAESVDRKTKVYGANLDRFELVPQAPPQRRKNEFFPGDKVRRVQENHMNMRPGDVATVTHTYEYNADRYDGKVGQSLTLAEFGGVHGSYNFELVVDEKKPAEPAGPGEFILCLIDVNGKIKPANAPRVFTSWEQAAKVGKNMASKYDDKFTIWKKVAEVSPPPSKPEAVLNLVA